MAAVSSPLLETSINGATGVSDQRGRLFRAGTRRRVRLRRTSSWKRQTLRRTSSSARRSDDNLEDEMRVTVIATGFDDKQRQQPSTTRDRRAYTPRRAKRPRVQPSGDVTTS
ncbi:MAG: hypothetical protein ACLR8U_02100 [Oscillospiraceae bacterium]